MPRFADPETRRAEIVSAAMSLVAAEGPEALSMRKIATHAGCTIGLLNHWFANKDELIEAIVDTASAAAVARAKVALAQPSVTLEDIVTEFLPMDQKRQVELKIWIIFWALSLSRPKLRSGYATRMSTMREEMIAEIRRRGIMQGDPACFVDTLMAFLDGLSVNAIIDQNYWTSGKLSKTLDWFLARTLPEGS